MDDLPLKECSCSSSLDPSETNPHPLHAQSRAQFALHAPTAKARNRIISTFHASTNFRLQRRAVKLGLCGISPTVRFERNTLPVCISGRCRDRLCPTCQRFRSLSVRNRISRVVKAASSVRFVTLTMPASSAPLRERVLSLWDSFRRLRRTKSWKSHVSGGVAVMEVTRGKEGTHWHAHLHMLISGSFYDQRDLQAAWSASVGELAIADIRASHDRNGQVRYLTDYITKPTKALDWSDEILCEFALAMHRVRSIATFGKWHNLRVENADEQVTPPKLPRESISFSVVADALESGVLQRERAAPLLAKLSLTWRLLMQPYLTDLRYVECEPTPDDLTEVTLFLTDFAATLDQSCEPAQPPPPPLSLRSDQIPLWTNERGN